LLGRHELALYDVIVNYRASGLCFTATFLAAVFGLAASIAVVLLTSGILLGIAWASFELRSVEGSSSDILTATSEILRRNLKLDMIYGQIMRVLTGVCPYEFYLSMSDGVSVGDLLASYLCFVFSALLNGVWDGLVLYIVAGGGFLLLLAIGGGVIALAFRVFGGSPCDICGADGITLDLILVNICREIRTGNGALLLDL